MKQMLETRSGRGAVAGVAVLMIGGLTGCLAATGTSREMGPDDSNPAMLLAGRIAVFAEDAEADPVKFVDTLGRKTSESRAAAKVFTYDERSGERVYRIKLYMPADETIAPESYGVSRVDMSVDCIQPGSQPMKNCDPSREFTLIKFTDGVFIPDKFTETPHPDNGWAIFNQTTEITDTASANEVARRALGNPKDF